jgi:glycosyltransferase involved in cell wall biosynthesis
VCHKYIDEEEGYFLFLGNTDPKKNTARTLKAYSKYLEKSEKKRKILIADLSWDYIDGLLTDNKITQIKNHIVAPGYIANDELPYIYNGAFAFLYTSLRESFGIPLLEAMACGTPVITSNTSSMPEIAGDTALLINPESDDEIADMMLKLENDENLYKAQKAYGLERAKMFSWRKTAEKLLTVYKQILKKA